jgi:hypothetical protein
MVLGAGYFNLPEHALNGVTVVIQGTDSMRTRMFLTGSGLAMNNYSKLVLKKVYLESSGGTTMSCLCHTYIMHKHTYTHAGMPRTGVCVSMQPNNHDFYL